MGKDGAGPEIEWEGQSRRKGTLHVAAGASIKFNFSGAFPRFKVIGKDLRKRLPPVIDLLPELALWEPEDHPLDEELLEKLEDRVIKALRGGDPGENRLSIDSKLLEALLALAREGHPNEVLFLLKRDSRGVLAEAVVPQGSKGGKTAAYILPSRLPYDPAIDGSFHSHPSGSPKWSQQDLVVFKRYSVNVIAHNPYTKTSFAAYDNRGNEIGLDVTSG